jgi:hypothetical protein
MDVVGNTGAINYDILPLFYNISWSDVVAMKSMMGCVDFSAVTALDES